MSEETAYRQIRYRLLPEKPANWRWLERTLEAQRQLYNAALQERVDCFEKTGQTIGLYDQFKSLTVCRRELPDMKAVPLRIQRGTLKTLDEAFRGFFRRARQGGAGFPKFKGRRHWDSFSVVDGIRIEGEHIRIPSFGRLRIRRHGGNPYPDGRATSAVFKRISGKWYVTVSYAVVLPQAADDGQVTGVDMNAGQVATSDGVLHRMPDMGRLEAQQRRRQRTVARRKRGSKRRARAVRQLAKTQRKIANKRHDWHHKTSRRIADGAHTVVIEDLKTANMTKSARGSVEEPGRNVKQKAGLNRVILGTGWGRLRLMLAYKAGRLIAVDPRHTSQTCAACGVVDSRSRRSQSDFRCVACGHADNADLNAAANIRRQGLAQLHGEGVAVRHPVNRENMSKLAA